MSKEVAIKPHQQLLTVIDGLLETHWRGIVDAKKNTEDGKINISIGIKLAKDGKNLETAHITLAYGVRVKDDIDIRMEDPNQTRLEYVIKKEE